MKTLIASALTATALFAGAAQAAPVSSEVQTYLPNANYSNLSDTQVAAINSVVHSGKNYNETRSAIRSILN
ncbi:hypothetical protein J4E08_17795 [Sagittula sp. NFXS13]|uniref:DUF4148 domain-containing protein n=1 Tax=Sagittula marina TaxID=943940 RepID=A0A7W6DT93_9RHOB|nr:hypothetical protein [Sagittula marina]MBB3986310.1 hypothetical protein [Sagittula marina]